MYMKITSCSSVSFELFLPVGETPRYLGALIYWVGSGRMVLAISFLKWPAPIELIHFENNIFFSHFSSTTISSTKVTPATVFSLFDPYHILEVLLHSARTSSFVTKSQSHISTDTTLLPATLNFRPRVAFPQKLLRQGVKQSPPRENIIVPVFVSRPPPHQTPVALYQHLLCRTLSA
ncbi:hypothetical protein CLAIMM_07370 [Cladophialophora immunda]|nr:hypothetical protein CLAIMM_07370 [Cladophialophora immunda]